MSYYCNDCCEIFDESEADSRETVLGDSMPPGTRVALCPYCGSDDLEEADTCERCGTPIPPDEHLCDDCRDDLGYGVRSLIESFRGDVLDGERHFFDYLEREWL